MEPERQGHASYTHVHEIIDNLKIIGWKVSLFCPRYKEGKLPGTLARLASIFMTNLRTIISPKPGVYYMRWHFAAFPTALWARLLKVPTVIEVNGPKEDLFIAWPITKKFKRFFSWLMVSQLRWAGGIVAVTEGLNVMSRELTDSNKQIVTIPNGANTDQFSPKALNLSNEYTELLPEKFMIFFGTMAPWQGIHTVLTALQETIWPEKLHVVFVGDGVERPAVEKVVEQVPHAHFLGRVPYTVLPSIIARAVGSFVCTENLEGRGSTGLAPLKMFESLSCGVPVIATDMPFQADLIRSAECGIVIQPEDSLGVAKAAAEIFDNENARHDMGNKGRDVVEKEHSWQARAKDTHELLVRVIKKVK